MLGVGNTTEIRYGCSDSVVNMRQIPYTLNTLREKWVKESATWFKSYMKLWQLVNNEHEPTWITLAHTWTETLIMICIVLRVFLVIYIQYYFPSKHVKHKKDD